MIHNINIDEATKIIESFGHSVLNWSEHNYYNDFYFKGQCEQCGCFFEVNINCPGYSSPFIIFVQVPYYKFKAYYPLAPDRQIFITCKDAIIKDVLT